jgi:hypothetical protein
MEARRRRTSFLRITAHQCAAAVFRYRNGRPRPDPSLLINLASASRASTNSTATFYALITDERPKRPSSCSTYLLGSAYPRCRPSDPAPSAAVSTGVDERVSAAQAAELLGVQTVTDHLRIMHATRRTLPRARRVEHVTIHAAIRRAGRCTHRPRILRPEHLGATFRARD